MQHFSNPVIATNEKIIFWAVFGFEEEECVCHHIITYMGMTVNGARPFEQILNPVSTVWSAWNLMKIGQVVSWNLVKIGQVVSEEKLFNNIMFLYMYTAQVGEDNPCKIKFWL